MARRLHLLLLLLTCLSVGLEILVAGTGLPLAQADQVHDCGPEDVRLAGDTDATETDPVDPPANAGQADPAARLVAAFAAEPARNGREGMRRHRWCGVDLN